MTPMELQLKIDSIIDRSFNPTRTQKVSAILTIVHSLGFEAVLSHALKTSFQCDDVERLEDHELDELFEIARTWRYQADQETRKQSAPVVVELRDGT